MFLGLKQPDAPSPRSLPWSIHAEGAYSIGINQCPGLSGWLWKLTKCLGSLSLWHKLPCNSAEVAFPPPFSPASPAQWLLVRNQQLKCSNSLLNATDWLQLREYMDLCEPQTWSWGFQLCNCPGLIHYYREADTGIIQVASETLKRIWVFGAGLHSLQWTFLTVSFSRVDWQLTVGIWATVFW